MLTNTTIPKYIQIKEIIREYIKSNNLSPDDMLPSVANLKSQYGVNNITVSKALDELVAEGIVYKIQGKGTFVNKINDRNIAVLCDMDLLAASKDSWHKHLVNTSIKLLMKKGYIPRISLGHNSNNEDFMTYTYLDEPNIIKTLSGAISTTQYDFENLFECNNIPLMECCMAVPKHRSCVVLNYDSLIEKGKKVLQEKNIKRFDVMYYQEVFRKIYHTDKMNQLINSLCVNGNKYIYPVIAKYGNDEEYGETFKNWWFSKDRADTLFILEDHILAKILDVIEELNIEIGKDLKILTHCNKQLKFKSNINFYKIGFDAEKAAKKLVDLLDKKIKNPDFDKIEVLEPEITVGDSLG